MGKIINAVNISRKMLGTCTSPEGRIKFAQKLNERLFQKIADKFEHNRIIPDNFESGLMDVLPKNVNISIQNNQGCMGRTTFLAESSTNRLSGVKIELPINSERQISIYDTDTLMHEAFHLFAGMSNPKHIARSAKIHNSGTADIQNKFYNKYLYSEENKLKKSSLGKKIDDFMKNFTNEEKIDFLQNCRYRLTEEKYAYKEGNKYLYKIQNLHKNNICEPICGTYLPQYHFSEKINLLNEKLKQVLLDTRTELKNMFMLKS